MTLRFATLCSGVDVPSLAWEPLGMTPVFFSEVASYPNAVLAARWPHVPNLGDITTLDGKPWWKQVDVLWASFPCQDFSEAGKRKGAAGNNGILTLAGVRLVDEIDPEVFCFENVRGLLTDDENAFGYFLGALAGEFGPVVPPGDRWSDAGVVYGPRRTIAWRVLDAQHFGVPQQRERVYLVACPTGSHLDPVEILHERGSEGPTLGERQRGRKEALDGPEGSTLARRVAIRGRTINGFYGQQIELGDDIANCLRTAKGGSSVGMVLDEMKLGVRRIRNLTPVECERLQGMPDDHTLIPGASDTARYNVIGNSLAVPVVRWIGERIKEAFGHETA